MRNILVTGACGFIGWKVCETLLARGDSVIAVDDLNDAYDVRLKEWRLAQLRQRSGFAFTRLDISDREAVRSFGQSMAAKGWMRWSTWRPGPGCAARWRTLGPTWPPT